MSGVHWRVQASYMSNAKLNVPHTRWLMLCTVWHFRVPANTRVRARMRAHACAYARAHMHMYTCV
jgi:hypothetical protein